MNSPNSTDLKSNHFSNFLHQFRVAQKQTDKVEGYEPVESGSNRWHLSLPIEVARQPESTAVMSKSQQHPGILSHGDVLKSLIINFTSTFQANRTALIRKN